MKVNYFNYTVNSMGVKILLFILFQVLLTNGVRAQNIEFSSPDKQLKVTLPFNDKTSWDAVFLVKMNASRNTQDYKITSNLVNQDTKLGIKLTSGGGYSAVITKM